MAWRPKRYLIAGELDNTKRGRVIGWMDFVGLAERVTFDLKGDFHRDIRGTRIRLNNAAPTGDSDSWMDSFSTAQTGAVGDITAGLPPEDYVDYPYVEWYSDQNGRVVLELRPCELEVVGTPYPWKNELPVPAEEQEGHLMGFLGSMASALNAECAVVGRPGERERNWESGPETSPRETEGMPFAEIRAACHMARVRIVEHFRPDDLAPTGHTSRGFFHQLGNGKEYGPFEHENQAYEDAFLTYYLWPW